MKTAVGKLDCFGKRIQRQQDYNTAQLPPTSTTYHHTAAHRAYIQHLWPPVCSACDLQNIPPETTTTPHFPIRAN